MAPQKPHARLASLVHDDGGLVVNGVPLRRLAARVGATPFYAYDRAAITARVAELRRALPGEVALHYAVKANPMPAIVGHLAALVDGFDVASAREMQVALDAGMRCEDVSFAGPGKRPGELRAAVAAGICINLESELEFERVLESGLALGIRPRVAVRVNPAFELKGAGMKMGGSPRQFGLDEDRVPALLQRIVAADVDLEGLHIFCGSQNLNAASIVEASQQTLALAAGLARSVPAGFRHVNIGGGYGIPYFPGDLPLDLQAVGSGLGAALDAFRPALGAARIVVELGRFLVGEAGYYVTTVTDIKVSKGQRFLVVDGGLHHHLANSGNFGQVLRKNYPVVIGTKLGGAHPLETVNIVGPLCTPLDIVADSVDLPRAELGDLVVVCQSGAYGLTASPTAFLSQPEAAEIVV